MIKLKKSVFNLNLKDYLFIGAAFALLFLPLLKAQLLVGTVVNALLYFIAWRFGVKKACFVALIPSLIALSSGVLPLAFASLVPFIMVSNILLVIVFAKIAKNEKAFSFPKFLQGGFSYFFAVIGSATIKAIFLSLAVLLIGQATVLALSFAAFQLIAAFSGGLLASTFVKLSQE